MIEIFKDIFEYIRSEEGVKTVVSIFVITLSLVYIPGRLLGFIRSPRLKNMVALLSIFTFTPLLLLEIIPLKILNLIIVSSVVIVVYTLLGMRIFDRTDSFLSKILGKSSFEEKEVPIKTKKKKTKPRKKEK